MAPGQLIQSVGIASAHHTSQRHAAFQAAIDDVIIAHSEPGIAERKLAQLVVAVRIDAGIVKNDIRLVRIDKRPDMTLNHRNIDIIACTRRNADIQIADFLGVRIIGLAVKRECKDGRLALEERRRAVALVHIAIDHQRLSNRLFAPQHADRHRHIVENTETRTVPGKGMMATAGNIAGKALFQGETRRQECAAHGRAAAPNQRR